MLAKGKAPKVLTAVRCAGAGYQHSRGEIGRKPCVTRPMLTHRGLCFERSFVIAVYVLDKRGKPLMPCTEKRARLLLERGRAGYTGGFLL